MLVPSGNKYAIAQRGQVLISAIKSNGAEKDEEGQDGKVFLWSELSRK